MRLTGLLVLALLLSTAASAATKKKAENAEVEITATLKTSIKASDFALFASAEPCDAAGKLTLFGSAHSRKAGSTFLEIFVPQGTTIHICGAALNEKHEVVARGRYEKNPVLGRGKGEVEFSDLTIDLAPLDKPLPAPAGL